MKRIIISILIFASGSCGNKPTIEATNFKPVPIEYFKQGDTLLPDMACCDTIIVMDAPGLNKAMGYIEQDSTKGSDSDYDSTFHIYCKVK